ncbi:MAG: hypothetical protein ACR2FI_07230 [Burkholderiales bacterium]|nr:hypothetical protein [Burkholderiales bacterium]MDQ3197116.1 hypothetical protein [Pseudomonadota bacterium]
MSSTVKEIQSSGAIIVLADLSKWQVSPADRSTARRWASGDAVALIGYRMTNLTRSNQTIQVKGTM